MPAPLLAAVYALAAALVWGTGDFAGGLAARRVGALRALLLSMGVGLLSMLLLAMLTGEAISTPADLLWGILAGLFGTAGFLCMLQGFSIGRMSIVAPVSAILAAVVPVIVAAFTTSLPSELQFLGFLLAFTSIWFVSANERKSANGPTGLGLAVLAGLGFGLFFTGLDQISDQAIFWPLVASRLVAGSLLVLVMRFQRLPVLMPDTPYKLVTTVGVLDAGGNLFFLLAVQTGRLDLTAVLVSLYPAVTVMWAALIAKEHLTRLQAVGAALAVLSIALITR
jgi:drug/metabolite transporter (DMT)-like permease